VKAMISSPLSENASIILRLTKLSLFIQETFIYLVSSL